MVGGGGFDAEEEKTSRFRMVASVSASVCWLWAFGGGGGAAEQGRTGLGWARQDRTGWEGVWIGWVGRSSVFGTLGCGPGGLQGGWVGTEVQEGPSRASIH